VPFPNFSPETRTNGKFAEHAKWGQSPIKNKRILIKYGETGKGTFYALVERAHKGLIKGIL